MSEPVMQRLKISREGIILIKSFEGFRPRAMPRKDGGWVIGYGHTASAREGASVSEADAELLLHYDLLPVAAAVNDGLSGPVNQHQFDALASFAYSVGVDRFQTSNVLQRLNAGATGEAADAMALWPEAPRPETALRRRAAERALFIADPDHAVTLSDLLSAPLPSPFPFADFTDDPGSNVVDLPIPAPFPAVETPMVPATRSIVTPGPQAEDTAATPDVDQVAEHGDAVALTSTAVPVTPAPPPSDKVVETTNPSADTESHMTGTTKSDPSTSEPLVTDAPAGIVVASEATAQVVQAPEVGTAPHDVTPHPASDNETATPAVVLTERAERTDRIVAPEPSPTEGDTPISAATVEAEAKPDPILRHEAVDETPPPFDWSKTGTYLVTGAFGLVSFGMSMVALRLAAEQVDRADETRLIAGMLAVIGVACIGVAAWNLSRRTTSKPDI